ncbi:MAG: aspartate kinase, partial [Chloroflexia bacterium]|nr:aspartate kinase [Chloroflexia bacterium]
MIVLKFGGTSVADENRIHQAAAIVESQPAPRVVVVSAASGVTNVLLAAARAAGDGDRTSLKELTGRIRAKHDRLAASVEAEANRLLAIAELDQLHARLDEALADVLAAGGPSPRDSDRIVATGEKAMSVLMAAVLRGRGLPATHVYADQVIATDSRFGNARPDRQRTRERAAAVVRPLLDEGQTVVITGFIAGSPDGETTTLGRGGSDYSATLLGAALGADEVQIWTDVPGVLSADPRRVEAARVV